MLLLFKIASFPVLGQGKINDKLFGGDSTKYVSVFGDSNIIQSYMKNFSIPKIQLPFDLKGKRPSELITNEDSTLNWKRFIPEIIGQIAIGYDAGQLANYFMPDKL